jgi:hypothetical protein
MLKLFTASRIPHEANLAESNLLCLSFVRQPTRMKQKMRVLFWFKALKLQYLVVPVFIVVIKNMFRLGMNFM